MPGGTAGDQGGRVVTCDHMATTRMGIRGRRDTLTTTIRRVRAGEPIEVTHDGVPVALVIPVPDDPVERLVALGIVSRPVPTDRPRRLLPVTGVMSASEAIADDRSQDR